MVDVSDDGKIADVCAFHEGGLTLYSSILQVLTHGTELRASVSASMLRSS